MSLFDTPPAAPTARPTSPRRRPDAAAPTAAPTVAAARPGWLRLPWPEQWTIPVVAAVIVAVWVTVRAVGGDQTTVAVPPPQPVLPAAAPTAPPPPSTTTTWFDVLACGDARPGCVPLLPYPITPEAERVIGLDRQTASHIDQSAATAVAAQLIAQWPADICQARVLREQRPDGSTPLVVRVDGTPRGTPLVECGGRT